MTPLFANAKSQPYLASSVARPHTMAAVLAALYVALCLAYIVLSTHFAAAFSSEVSDLATLELLKGSLFVVLSGAIFYGIALYLLRRLDAAVNDLNQHQRALLQSEQRAIAGVFAASTAHDINNSLMALSGVVFTLRMSDKLGRPETEAVELLDRAFDDLKVLSNRLFTAGRTGLAAEMKVDNLAKVVRDGVQFTRTHKHARRCTIELKGPEMMKVFGHAQAVEQMLINLILNAAQATNECGKVSVKLSEDDRGHVVLEVHDDGPGVPPELRVEIFDAFYTTKPGGNGLGLLSARACTELHKGTLVVSESPLGGALFRFVYDPANLEAEICEAVRP